MQRIKPRFVTGKSRAIYKRKKERRILRSLNALQIEEVIRDKWNTLMADTKSLRYAYNLLRAEYTLLQVQPILDALQLLVELLQDYLQAKRLKYFPFFFISDRKLIEILSMGVRDLSSFTRSGIIKGIVGITRSHDDPNILKELHYRVLDTSLAFQTQYM